MLYLQLEPVGYAGMLSCLASSSSNAAYRAVQYCISGSFSVGEKVQQKKIFRPT